MRQGINNLGNGRQQGYLWPKDHNSFGWIVSRQRILHEANLLGIKNIILGKEQISDIASIQLRAPGEKAFVLSQLTKSYSDSVKSSTERNLQLFITQPLKVYEQEAQNLAIANAGIAVDHTLLDVFIPQIPAGSINVPPSVKERHNILVRGAKSPAERNAALPVGGLFIENNATVPISTIRERSIAKQYAELENRNERPDPNADIDVLKGQLDDDQKTEAASKFSTSEGNREQATNRIKEINKNALHFFNYALGEGHIMPICGTEVKNHQWNQAFEKIELTYTKPETSDYAVERSLEILTSMKYNDPELYEQETLEHYKHRLLIAEVHHQLAKQMHERTPPMQNLTLGAALTPVLSKDWQLDYEELLMSLHDKTDAEIIRMKPHAIIYRRMADRHEAVVNGICVKGGPNENFKNTYKEEVNLKRTEYSITNFMSRVKFLEKQKPQEEQMLQTILKTKSKPITINNISTTKASSSSTTDPKGSKEYKQEIRHCKTCKKYRPDIINKFNKKSLYTSHNTDKCFLEHGAKYNPNDPRNNNSTTKSDNTKSSGKTTSSKRSRKTDKPNTGRSITIAKKVKIESKNNNSDADDEDGEENEEDAEDEERADSEEEINTGGKNLSDNETD